MITFNCDLSTRHSAAKVPQKKKENGGQKKLFRASPQAIHCNILAANRQFEKFKFFPLTKIFIQVDDDKERENLSGRFVSCFS